jgi:hypothetical protein
MFGEVKSERDGPSEVRPESFKDPLMAEFSGPEPIEPDDLIPGSYWCLRPGEAIREVSDLPRHHSSQQAVFFGGEKMELVIDGDSGRRHMRVPTTPGDETSEEVACRMISILVHRRTTGHINEPDRFLVLLNPAGRQLARIDDSDSWEFRIDSLQRICALAGVVFEFEHYENEGELLAARPSLTPAHIELEVDHPVEADVRDFGMALWFGAIISIGLCSAGGMEFIFGTPAKYAVVTLAAGGLVVATTITWWSRLRWSNKHFDR